MLLEVRLRSTQQRLGWQTHSSQHLNPFLHIAWQGHWGNQQLLVQLTRLPGCPSAAICHQASSNVLLALRQLSEVMRPASVKLPSLCRFACHAQEVQGSLWALNVPDQAGFAF